MRRISQLPAFVFICLLPIAASGQGVLLDLDESHQSRLPRRVFHPRPRPQPPQQSYKIKELAINTTLQDQIAKVQVSQSFVNTGSRQMEVCFVFPLPHDGAVDQMTFMVDGKEYEAKLLSAKEARRIYEGYVRRNQDPALMEWIGTGMFKTSVFPVPAGATRTVTLRYSQICRTASGLTELLLPMSTAKYTSHPVEKVNINVNIRSSAKIKNVYSPTHAVKVKRPTDQNAVVEFDSTNEIPSSDFRLMYDVGDASVGASVVSYRPKGDQDGYFLLLVSPEIKREDEEALKKNVIFVVDRSGSMSGKKIEQAKGALRFVLNNLNEGDLFNIIAYDSAVESFQPELQRFDDENRKAALGFVEGIYAGGSTNIDGALKAALGQLHDDSRPNYIVFLTDGLPTVGEKNESKIVKNAKQSNKAHARVFSFGVGYDVNSRMLDRLSRTCFGQSQYVRPNEDIEEHVSQLYNRIGAPVMTNVAITFDMEGFAAEQGTLVSRVYPKAAFDLFAGDQLVLVGRYKMGGAAKVVIRGKVGDREQQLDFPAKLVDASGDETHGFVEKLWAMRRVGEIIDEIDLHGQNQELVDELVVLSTKHGIITPYTSFLADETTNLRELAANGRRARFGLEQLSRESGRDAFEQRGIKAFYQRAYNLQSSSAGAAPTVKRLADGEEVVVQNVQNVGGKTFFMRKKRWVDSTVTDKQEQEAKKIQRYSKEYFDLISKHGKDAAKYLAIEGQVTIVLDGQAYSF
jgi:Ca-activated chloride channel family protein